MLNDISRDINDGIRQARKRRPSTLTVYRWQQEYIATGADRRMTFYQYKQNRLREYYAKKKNSK